MSFAALMALSATQTQRNNESVVTAALQQKQQKEVTRRKEQEERERKERELEKRLREKHFQDEKDAIVKAEKRAQLEASQEAALQKRKAEERDALVYGKKAPPKIQAYPSSNPDAREGIRKRRLPTQVDGHDDERGGSAAGMALTRQELREQKLQRELKKTFNETRRTAHGTMGRRAGAKLPGGAVDIVFNEADKKKSVASGGGIKARMAAQPNGLQMLNVQKRDVRSIDEILADKAKKAGKSLYGDEARGFGDWFSTKKEKEAKAAVGVPAPSPPRSQSAVASGSKLPPPRFKASSSTHQLKKEDAHMFHSSGKPKARGRTPPTTTKSKPVPASSKQQQQRRRAESPPTRKPVSKRPREEYYSDEDEYDSPPPKKHNAIGDEIWKLFGKDRQQYVERDDYSDDDDMEVDASALAREESRSSRIAHQEDVRAKEEEKRHEEEKRRRKKEREARERR